MGKCTSAGGQVTHTHLICPAERFIAPVFESKFTPLILFLPDGVRLNYYAIGEWHGCESSSLQDLTSVQTIKFKAALQIPSWPQCYALMGCGYSRVGWRRLTVHLILCSNFHCAMFSVIHLPSGDQFLWRVDC